LQHSEYLKILDADLQRIRMAAEEVQKANQAKRRGEDVLNSYITGDLVLFDEASRGVRSKLKPRHSGPYIITSVYKADVTCSHLVTGKEKVFHMEHLKPYFGERKDAYKAALADDDQFVVENILDYRGDSMKRSQMEFLVLFEDGDELWILFNQDLAASAPFREFCQSLPELEPLLFTEKDWRVRQSSYNAGGVVGVEPGQSCYVTLRAWGSDYYHSVGLPRGSIYVVLCKYTKWTTKKKKKIDLKCEFFKKSFDWDATAVRLYGLALQLQDDMVLITEEMTVEYPNLRD